MKYRIYGIVLQSDEPLPELAELALSQPAATDVSLVHLEEPAPSLAGAVVLPPLPNSPAPAWPTTMRGCSHYSLNFADQAVFWVETSGRAIRCFPGSAPRETLMHLLLDHVLPRTLYLFGLDPLHATAVALAGDAVAFLGPTGSGKSSMAAALAAIGCELVTDDCLVLRQRMEDIVATPGYSGLRLYSDSRAALCPSSTASALAHYTEKQRISGLVRLTAQSPRLRAMYVLSRADAWVNQLQFEPLGPGQAVVALVGQAFRMDIELRDPLTRQLRFFSRVAASIPIRRCLVPSNLAALKAFAGRVLDDAFGT